MTPSPSSPNYGGNAPTLSSYDSGQDRTAVVKEDAAQVAQTAKQGVADVAQETTAQAREVTNKAKDHARELVGQASSEVRTRAEEQTQRAAGGLDQLATRVQALLQGRPEEAGPLRDYAEQLGDRAQQVAEQLRNRGLDGVLSDVRSFAQRRPGMFLAGAAAAGFAVGRLVKAERSASSSDSSSGWDGSRTGVYTGGMGPSGVGYEPVYGTTDVPAVPAQAYPTPGLESYPATGVDAMASTTGRLPETGAELAAEREPERWR